MSEIVATAAGVIVLVGFGIGAFFKFGPGQRLGAMADAMLGTPDVPDRHGGVMTKGSPGLVDRVSTLEDAVQILVDQDSRIRSLEDRTRRAEDRLGEHDSAIAALIATTFEKGAAQALKAEELRQQGVVNGETGETD